ncbi:MAG: hypothetical protein P8O07_09630 [Crocinitomicaceae bacterium]|nr:hypothetical protein [Crocinitomicaceae bacterium]
MIIVCQFNEINNGRKNHIIRSYQSLDRDCNAYFVMLAGSIKLIES